MKKIMFLALLLLITTVGLLIYHEDSNMVASDRIFRVEGYKQTLSSMGYDEIRAFPYFHEPFIVVGQNRKGEQHAVLFRASGNVDVVKLGLSYELILDKFESYGYPVKSPAVNTSNVYLHEINNKMIWAFINGGDSGNTVYLNDKGEKIDPFNIK